MNRKQVLGRNFIVSFFAFLIFFFTSLTFFLVTKQGEIRETDLIANNIITRIDEDDETISTLQSAYRDSPLIRVTFYDIDSNIPIADTLNHLEPDPDLVLESKTALSYDSAFQAKAFRRYQRCQKQKRIVLRVSKKPNDGYLIAHFLFLWGSMIVALLCISFYVLLYLNYKKSLIPLKTQIRKMQQFVQPGSTITYDEDINYMAYILRDSRHRLMHQLEENAITAQKMDFILDSFSQGLIVIDASYKVVMINKQALSIFQKQKSDVQTRYFEALEAPHDFFVNFSMVIQTEKPIQFIEHIGTRVYQCDINTIQYDWAKSLNREEKNGASLLMIDITDDYNSSEMKKEFFANASHELKSPLTSLLGYMQLIENGTIQGDAILPALEKCIQDAQRMDKIISDMLTLSSLEREALRPIEEILLPKALDQIISTLQYQLQEKKIAIHRYYEPLSIKMSPDDFERMTKNLIENAIKYNKEHGNIYLTIEKEKRNLIIKDDGIGIAKENQSRVFERFYRVDKARSRRNGGTGLGLAIVKHICNYYELTITLDSELGKGSAFTIHFPE